MIDVENQAELLPVGPDADEGLYRLVDAAYERSGAVWRSAPCSRWRGLGHAGALAGCGHRPALVGHRRQQRAGPAAAAAPR